MSRKKMDETQSIRIDMSVLKEIRKESDNRKTTQRVIVEDAWKCYKKVVSPSNIKEYDKFLKKTGA